MMDNAKSVADGLIDFDALQSASKEKWKSNDKEAFSRGEKRDQADWLLVWSDGPT